MKKIQPSRLFKPLGFLAGGIAAVSMFLLSGCVMPDGGALPYDPVARHNYNGNDADAYRKGYQFGRSDARQGRTRNYMRYSSQYNSATKKDFGAGYMRAYDLYKNSPNGGWNGGNNGWNGGNSGWNGGGGNAYGGTNYTASLEQGRVRIMQNGRTVSVLRTELPNVERYQFRNGKREIVVKSRANHGPAVVELFDAKTGVRRGKVMAFAIQNGQPAWARGMQD